MDQRTVVSIVSPELMISIHFIVQRRLITVGKGFCTNKMVNIPTTIFWSTN